MQTISIIGIGRAGGALAIALDRVGAQIDRLIFRSEPPELIAVDRSKLESIGSIEALNSDVVIIATADPDIRPTSEKLSTVSEIPKVALHLSGSLSSEELAALRERGCAVGSMHPLVSISDPGRGSERVSGAYFCLEGDPEAVLAATSIVKVLGGKHFSIDTHFKPLYHASAVMASGNVVALFDSAIEMLSKCGLEPQQSHRILLPLLQSTVANLSASSAQDALTGPFVRGDQAAFERHLEALDENVDPLLRSIYLDLAERSLKLAWGEVQREFLTAISVAKRKTEC